MREEGKSCRLVVLKNMSKKHKVTVQKQFTKTAEAFSVYAVRDTAAVVAEKVEFAKPQSTDVVLDVACGPGAFVLALAPRVQFARGLDLTPEMLTRARAFQAERQISNVDFVCGDSDQLPFPDGSFDLVTCQMAIHHMSKPESALKEMVRVTKAEGRLLVIDTLGPESDAKFELHNRVEKLRDPSHTLTLRLTTFLQIFDNEGLEIERQALRRRARSFNHWMLRAGLEPKLKRYQETRKMLEDSLPGDRAGFSAIPQDNDIQIIHNEGMFLLTRKLQE
jgi:ubiquinone/menaquinone biosynthesis C-methylase UbiE